jgi:hypothetical protein
MIFEAISVKQDKDKVKKIWNELFQHSNNSFFISWAWVDTWLDSMPSNISIKFLVAYQGNQPLLAFLVGGPSCNKSNFLSINVGYVGATGEYDLDDIVIEHNGILVSNTMPVKSIPLGNIFKALDVDKINLPGITEENIEELNEHVDSGPWKVSSASISTYYVCLEKVRKNECNYLSLLSANKLRQIKKSTSIYSSKGVIQIELPPDIISALALFDKLVVLHQKEWIRRDKNGAFSNNYILNFHKELIKNHYNEGKIRIYHLYNSVETIGVVYGFISQNDFLYYQSGFHYGKDNRCKPGLTCHSLLIEIMANEGLRRYDFLAGDVQYKRSLGTDSYQTLDIELYSDSLKSKMHFMVHKIIKKQLKKFLSQIKEVCESKS